MWMEHAHNARVVEKSKLYHMPVRSELSVEFAREYRVKLAVAPDS